METGRKLFEVVNEARKVWEESKKEAILALSEEKQRLVEEINRQVRLYGYRESNRFDKLYERCHEEGESLGQFMRKNCGDLVEIYVPEEFLEDYYNILDEFIHYPYTRGYDRRTLRSDNPIVFLDRALVLMEGYLEFSFCKGTVEQYIRDDLEEIWLSIKRDDYVQGFYRVKEALDDIIAARIYAGDQSVVGAIKEAFLSDNNHVAVSVEMIRAVVKSPNKELRDILGRFLVAARLQEGLRQAICENADCGHKESLVEIMEVIRDNQLLRFSSVKRAVATWTGVCDTEHMDRITDKVFACALEAAKDKEAARQMTESDDAVSIVLGLWGIGFHEVTHAMATMRKMLKDGNRHGVLVAGYFNRMLSSSRFTNDFAICVMEQYRDDEEMIAVYMPTYLSNSDRLVSDVLCQRYGHGLYSGQKPTGDYRKIDLSELYLKEESARVQYEILKKVRNSMKKKKMEVAPCIFPWFAATITKSEIVKKMAVIAYSLEEETYIDEVCQMLSDIDGTYSERSTYIELLLHNPKNDFQKMALIDYLKDKEQYARKTAYKILVDMTFTEEEYKRMETFLKYKNEEIRRYTLDLLRRQHVAGMMASTKRILSSKDENMRLAGLDLAKWLWENENTADVQKLVKESLEGEVLSAPIMILYDQIVGKDNTKVTEESHLRYGLYDSAIQTPIPEVFGDLEAFHNYFNMTRKELDEKFQAIVDFLDRHYRDEYQTASSTWILGNGIYPIHNDYALPYHKRYPFEELWEEMYHTIIQTHRVFYNLMLAMQESFHGGESGICEYELYKEKAIGLYGEEQFGYEVDISKLKQQLPEDKRNYSQYGFRQKDLIRDAFRIIQSAKNLMLPKEIILAAVDYALKIEEPCRWYHSTNNGYICTRASYHSTKCSNFVDADKFSWLLEELRKDCTDEEYKQAFCSLYHLDNTYSFDRIYRENQQNSYYVSSDDWMNKLNVYDYIKAFSLGLITEADVYRFIFEEGDLKICVGDMNQAIVANPTIRSLNCIRSYMPVDYEERTLDENHRFYQALDNINKHVVDTILSVELKRGDSETEFSKTILKIKEIYGIERMIEILRALGDMPLDRNTYYYYSSNVVGKKECLCHLLKVCMPEQEDDGKKLKKLAKENGISKDRLIEVAMYASQWMDIIEEYLECDGFASGCYYFMAHMNDYFSKRTEAIIAKYTPLTREELSDGAFDLQWFFDAYNRLGEKMFDKLYKSAKYISDGSKHARARKYALAALGKVDKEEVEKTICEKRNKDLLMSYALIPIKDEKDVQRRYEFIQQFLKESKQFGAQRRVSEAKAVEMTLKNLANVAGYEDELRLTLAMETSMVQEYAAFFEPAAIGDYMVWVLVDIQGNASIQFEKDGKRLKSAPAAIKKNEAYLKVKEFEKKLKEQYVRCISMFEKAMEEQIHYKVSELKNLLFNPVTKAILEQIVFIIEEEGNKWNETLHLLKDFGSEDRKIGGNLTLRIAHPVDFAKSGEWEKWQRYFFEITKEYGIKQPFKQVYREYYKKLDEELGSECSRQFAGYQISPTRTVAALKTRGWVADYENGLQKVYYKANIIASLYAMADWFTPADTEAPTLEYVVFYDRKTLERMKIENVPEVIYSEVCRDTDLAVSLAHVGGVDPETTHSTIEMRTVIAKFNLELFQIDNVTFEKSHAYINGKYGEYSIHLGSGVVHKIGGNMISVLPVHSQARGKIFLPFIDEDPKTAEIMSKILLFARDDKIKDPYIMRQIVTVQT